MSWLTVLFLWLCANVSDDPVFYRSKSVPFQGMVRQSGAFHITDDKGHTATIELYLDSASKSIYWYRRLFTEVCLTGECRPIDIGIYWTGNGKYLGVEIFRENLTKTDHSDFSDFDYLKLESILRNEWSPLREFEFEELVEEKKEGTDATTGATKKVIADASVKDAVYTTYTMWHLIHVGEGEQLSLLTYRYLSEHPDVLTASLTREDPAYFSFLIEGMMTHVLPVSDELIPLILTGLNHDNAELKNTAFRAIGLLPANKPDVQKKIAAAYPSWSIPDKTRFLRSVTQLQVLHKDLYEALSRDLSQANPWFLTALLPVLAKSEDQSAETLSKVKEIDKSGNSQLEEAARKFLSVAGSAQLK